MGRLQRQGTVVAAQRVGQQTLLRVGRTEVYIFLRIPLPIHRRSAGIERCDQRRATPQGEGQLATPHQAQTRQGV